MDNEQLDIKLRAVLSQAVDEFNKLNKSAINFDESLTSIVTKTGKLGTFKTSTFINNTNKDLQKLKITTNETGKVISQTFSKTAKSGNNLKNGLSTVFDANKLYLYWNLTKRLRTSLMNVFNSAVDYLETQNKFNMSMGTGKPQAIKFVNQISEAIGIAKNDLMDYQSTYKNILSGLGNFSDTQSEKISESLVKMALDYSSLFNVSQANAMEKFQSALVGSIRPIRSDSGYDVSDTTIGAKAQQLGIDRSVNQLNQMEKRLLRIMVLMDQLRNTGAMGDLARTIEQPANQMRVLKAQIQEVGVWLGNVFMGTIGKILPYINAFVMVIKELIKMFAIFVGYQGDNSNLSDIFESVDTSSAGVSDNLGSANKKAKELKKTLMGFDVLNVINTPTQSSSSGGGGGIGSIDPAILNALGEYNSMMENVRMKATDIRDKIMDWLGFTKIINPETGEISWKLNEGLTNLEKILEVIKLIGVAFATWKISKGLSTLLSGLGLLSKGHALQLAFGLTFLLTGLYAQYKGTEHLLDGDIDLFTILETVLGTAGGAFGIVRIMNALKLGKTLTFGNKLRIGFSIMLLIQAIQTAIDGIKNDNIVKQVAAALETGVGAGLLFKSFKGGVITAAAVMELEIAISMIKWIAEYKDDQKKQLFGDKEDLTFGETLAVGFTSIGRGEEKVLDSIFGEHSLDGITMWVAKVRLKFREVKKTIQDWWTYDVAPWFTAEKWGELAEGIKKGISTKWDEFKNWWSNTAIVKWWNENVAPWFTLEKWQELANNAKTGIENKFNEWKNNFHPVQEWWNTKIAPWFTIEKWKEVANNAKTGIENKFNEWKNNFHPIQEWWNEKIAPWFTWKKWKELADGAIEGLKSAFSNFSFPHIKTPHFEITYETNGIIADVFKTMGMQGRPKVGINWYAQGGIPDIGELFLARESGPELVGKIGNNNAVMNNQQIVQAVSQGVAQAVSSVMNNGRYGDIRIIVDGKELTTVVEERMLRNQNIYGVS